MIGRFKNHPTDGMVNIIYQSSTALLTPQNPYQSCKNVHDIQYKLFINLYLRWLKAKPSNLVSQPNFTLDKEIVMNSGLKAHKLNAKSYPFLCKNSFWSTSLDLSLDLSLSIFTLLSPFLQST